MGKLNSDVISELKGASHHKAYLFPKFLTIISHRKLALYADNI